MSDSHPSLNASEEEDDFVSNTAESPSMKGTLSKWTNYIHGWQDRWVTCGDGMMCYYRSENETEYGCRGSISLTKASITLHEFDPCRFDIAINDSLWYMRASDVTERGLWIEAIESNKDPSQTGFRKTESGYGSDGSSLRRHGSMISIGSGLSITSSSSFMKGRGLQEKLLELETFRDILCRQVDTLQHYFDQCANEHSPNDIHERYNCTNDLDADDEFDHAHEEDELMADTKKKTINPTSQHDIDFRGEAITFKATTAGIIATLSHCLELMSTREETWQRRLEKEREKRRRVEEQLKNAIDSAKQKNAFVGSPDFEEGPQSSITEEQFFDAVEAELDKQDRIVKDIVESKSKRKEALLKAKIEHKYSAEMEKRIKEHVVDAQVDPATVKDCQWELFTEEGEMKLYRRELEEDGLICDPLKAIHCIDRVTSYEMCHYFWDTDVRMEWETTIESFRVIEAPNEHTSIIYQTHRRVWPASQRDCLYISSIEKVDDEVLETAGAGDGVKPHDSWIVCNFSIDNPDVETASGTLRAIVSIALICETYVTPPPDGGPITRDCLKCRIVYVANVNPGGWAPAAVLRTVYKREYPKFLRQFTAYVQNKTVNKEINFGTKA